MKKTDYTTHINNPDIEQVMIHDCNTLENTYLDNASEARDYVNSNAYYVDTAYITDGTQISIMVY